jgi:restriction endonuclease Mrr
MGKTDKSTTKQGTDFEMEIFTLLKSLGFKIERDVLIAGRQIDLVAKYELPLDNVYCVIIECKDHQSRVNVTQIERFGVVKSAIERRMDVDGGFFISRSGFTKEAKAFAKELKIKPITYDEIVESLNEMRIKKEIIDKEVKKVPLVTLTSNRFREHKQSQCFIQVHHLLWNLRDNATPTHLKMVDLTVFV